MKTVLAIAAAMIALILLVAASSVGKPAMRKDTSGVYYIDVGEESNYIIDPRYNLCFFETRTQNGVAVTSIPCSNFEDIMHRGQ